ncbi:putative lipid-binding transport protein (Tim44 family) [Chelatococcus caeni]|uniref:Putative lipid-binding transport protein (Tim44 family) n=1 Tax=Chelatococcus caeni TaxID=1348468 RepID=A0A840C4K4_9HYPH|nr:hypothetical protein [Chelatococcus caeni]MBB4017866.1 putative lipid-binding transport protein (Tim44 family) [Chelatococcus caeni]
MLIIIALGALVLGLFAGRRGKAVAWAGGSLLAAVAGGIAGGASGGWSGLAAGAGTAVLAFNMGLMLVLLLELARAQRGASPRGMQRPADRTTSPSASARWISPPRPSRARRP